MRLAVKRHARFGEVAMRAFDVVDLVIDDRPGRGLRSLRRRQHQPRLAALEEAHAGRRVEQPLEAEQVAVEMPGALEVLDGEGDLGDAAGTDGNHGLFLRYV